MRVIQPIRSRKTSAHFQDRTQFGKTLHIAIAPIAADDDLNLILNFLDFFLRDQLIGSPQNISNIFIRAMSLGVKITSKPRKEGSSSTFGFIFVFLFLSV
jgi:hypothetical protein